MVSQKRCADLPITLMGKGAKKERFVPSDKYLLHCVSEKGHPADRGRGEVQRQFVMRT